MKRTRARIAAALILVVVAGAFLPAFPGHSHAGETMVPVEWQGENPGPYVIDVTVAVDEEWLASYGADAEQQARRVLEMAANNFKPADLDLRVAELTTWRSADHAETIHPLFDTFSEDPAGEGRFLVALTAGSYAGGVDGLARAGIPQAVIRHHEGSLKRDAYVLTHEIGHVFSLHHHACEDGLCFMADHGYDPDEHWCPEHLELLRSNAGYFEYTSDLPSDAPR